MQNNLLISGYLSDEEAARVLPAGERLTKGPVAVIECVQDIPCNPCEYACPFKAIKVGEPITSLPKLDSAKCTGCGACIPQCPGLAIFVVDSSQAGDTGTVSLPYEYRPLPNVGDRVDGLNRGGQPVVRGMVTRVALIKGYDHTAVVTVSIPKEYVNSVRGIRV